MTSENPYSTPNLFETGPTVGETASTRRLWIAYGIAPLVPPLIAAIALFVVGIIHQTTYPDDVEVNPMALIVAPLFLLIVGVPVSYGVAGLIGMPIAFWLRRRGKLNGYTVHGAALLSSAVLAVGLAIVALATFAFEGSLPESGEFPIFIQIVAIPLSLFVTLTPLILLSATMFWLIGVRQWKRVI